MVTYGYPTEEDKAKWPAIEAEANRLELMAIKKAEISALEIKNLRKLYDGEDMTAVNAERMRLRSEIQKLEKPSAV